MLNTGTSLISDVIGDDSESSAFVYGCYSLFDKFANGCVLFIAVKHYSKDAEALKWILGTVPVATAIVAYLFTFIGVKFFSHKLAKITGVDLKE